MQAPSSRLVVLRAPFGAAASGGIAAYCAFRVVADEMELLSLAVTPEWRLKGLGAWLARLAFGMGARSGARAAFLEVRSGNEPALRLYASLGLQQTGRRARYYKDPPEDAVILTRALPASAAPRYS
jgi:[ribosomal protein S18]-alanine N-acetyltransferase